MTRLFAGTAFDIPPTCDHCGKLEADCVCTAKEKAARQAAAEREANRLEPSQQIAAVTVEKRKGNRQVTVIRGLTSQGNDLPDLLTQLQSACGAGGTVKPKDDLIELQGDHHANVTRTLAGIGYRVRK